MQPCLQHCQSVVSQSWSDQTSRNRPVRLGRIARAGGLAHEVVISVGWVIPCTSSQSARCSLCARLDHSRVLAVCRQQGRAPEGRDGA